MPADALRGAPSSSLSQWPRSNGTDYSPVDGDEPTATPIDIEDDPRLQRRSTPLQIFLYLIIALGGIGSFRCVLRTTKRTAADCDCRCRVRPLTSPFPWTPSPDPGDVNRLRRQLALDDPPCYERHFATFATYARKRLDSATHHLSLHIPKAGGTSLCELAKRAGMDTSTKNNCWEAEHFMPLWADARFGNGDRKGWTDGANATMCEEMDRALPDFIMNENYLDHPLCLRQRLYSVLLRDPIERVVSNEKHLMTFQVALNRSAADTAKRLALVRNNYVTWALTAGATPHEKRLSVTPRRGHLELAKDTLSRFDFLMELSRNATCERAILHRMGLGEIQRLNVRQGAKVALEGNHSREEYEGWNALDVELLEHARRLMGADCDFFLRLGEDR